MQQHVRILILRRLGAIALRIRVGGDVKRIPLQHGVDVMADICGELRVDFVEHVLPIEQRPHFTHRFVAHAGDDAADGIQHRIGGAALGPPILLAARQFVGHRMPLAVLLKAQYRPGRRRMLHVVDACANVDQRLEHGMKSQVCHAFAVDIHLARITDGLQILLSGPYQRLRSILLRLVMVAFST